MQVTIGVLGAAAVALGAFGSHGLKAVIEPDQLSIWQTGIQYHFAHLLLLALAMLLQDKKADQLSRWAFWLGVAGILLFSGSLYGLATRSLLGTEGWWWLGPITPIGGLCFITGWLLYAFAAWRNV